MTSDGFFPPLLLLFFALSARAFSFSSQMSVEGDDKRTRTRSKGIRGECRSLRPSLQQLHLQTLLHSQASLLLFDKRVGSWTQNVCLSVHINMSDKDGE